MNDDDSFPTAPAVGTSERPALTVKRVAFLGNISEASVRRAIRDGRLPCVPIGRAIRILPRDADAFLASSRRSRS